MQIQPDINSTALATQASATTAGQVQPVVSMPPSTTTAIDTHKDAQLDVQNSVKNMQKNLDLMNNTSFQIDYDKDIDRVIVKYVSRDSGEVVSQIPSKEFVNFEKEFVKTIGLLFDKSV